MKRILLWYSIFLFSCKSVLKKSVEPPQANNGLHTVLRTGLPSDVEYAIQESLIAEKFGVKYHSLGCLFKKSTLDSVKNINDSISKIVALNFGQNWRLKLSSQLDSMEDIRNIVYSDMLNRKKNHNEHLYFLEVKRKVNIS